jgi:magnesium-transporting ATPase (P-type)
MNLLRGWAWVVLIAMVGVTVWASLHQSIFEIIQYFPHEPWWVATLFDTYFAFIFFWLWILYREGWSLASLSWLVAIVLLGNIAMSIYMLWALHKAQNLSDLFREKSR